MRYGTHSLVRRRELKAGKLTTRLNFSTPLALPSRTELVTRRRHTALSLRRGSPERASCESRKCEHDFANTSNAETQHLATEVTADGYTERSDRAWE